MSVNVVGTVATKLNLVADNLIVLKIKMGMGGSGLPGQFIGVFEMVERLQGFRIKRDLKGRFRSGNDLACNSGNSDITIICGRAIAQ